MNMNDSSVLRFLILFTRLSLFSALLQIGNVGIPKF